MAQISCVLAGVGFWLNRIDAEHLFSFPGHWTPLAGNMRDLRPRSACREICSPDAALVFCLMTQRSNTGSALNRAPEPLLNEGSGAMARVMEPDPTLRQLPRDLSLQETPQMNSEWLGPNSPVGKSHFKSSKQTPGVSLRLTHLAGQKT